MSSSQDNSHITGTNHSFYGGNNYSTSTKGPSYNTTIGNVHGISNVGATFQTYATGDNNTVKGMHFKGGAATGSSD